MTMTAREIQERARALAARIYHTDEATVRVVAVESYGLTRLYPISATADAVAALASSRTLDEAHLALAVKIGGVVIRRHTLAEIQADAARVGVTA